MTTDRAYRRARTFDAACQELRRSAGRQFNPRVVEAFLAVLERDDAVDATYLRPLRERGTANFTSKLLTLAEAGQQGLLPGENGAGQIGPQQIKELNVMHHLARSVSAIPDLDLFLDSAVALIKRELGYADGAILLCEEETAHLVVRAISGFEPGLRGRCFPESEGLIGRVLTQGLVQNVPSIERSDRYTAWMPTNRSALLAPLINAGQPIGVVVIESPREAAFTPDDEMALETIANQLTTGIAVARLHDREKRAAITDGLTGVYNHRYFYQRLEQELAGAESQGYGLTVVVMDLNGLKALNDTHGHLAGDTALRAVAGILRDCTRESDTVARYGGDEFAVILPSATVDDANQLLDRLRSRLATHRALGNGVLLAPLTVSAGVAAYPADGLRAAALVAVADERMYAQKRATKRTEAAAPSERAQARRRIMDRLGEIR
jgi:diguanylate cyclase (GGDEF)-like protein